MSHFINSELKLLIKKDVISLKILTVVRNKLDQKGPKNYKIHVLTLINALLVKFEYHIEYTRRIESQITADNYTFDIRSEFVYLDSAITRKNYVNLEINRRIVVIPRSQ